MIKYWSAPKDSLAFLFESKDDKELENVAAADDEPLKIESTDAAAKSALPWLLDVLGLMILLLILERNYNCFY